MSSSAVTKDTAIQPSEFLEIGDIITIINDSKYYNVLKINNFLSNGGGIQAKWIDTAAFTTIKATSPLNTDDYTVYCLAKPGAGIVDIGKSSVAIGEESRATNLGAFATGYKNTSWGNFGFTEGRENEAGYIGHAEGHHTKASGMRAHAEGYYTISKGSSSHAEGQHTRADGQASHIEGHSNSDVSDETVAKNIDEIISDWNATKFSLARGVASHVEGKDNLGLGNESHAEGFQTVARGNYSHAEGSGTVANGQCSHTEGSGTTASANFSHAEGANTNASGVSSHAEGTTTTASGQSSHAEGCLTHATGGYSHAEGYFTTASGETSHAEGYYTIVRNKSEHAEGQCNVSHSATTEYGSSGNTQHSVGIGTSYVDTKNAFEIMQNGDAYLYGVGSYSGATLTGASTLQTVISGKPDIFGGTNKIITITEEEYDELAEKDLEAIYVLL